MSVRCFPAGSASFAAACSLRLLSLTTLVPAHAGFLSVFALFAAASLPSSSLRRILRLADDRFLSVLLLLCSVCFVCCSLRLPPAFCEQPSLGLALLLVLFTLLSR